MPLASIDWSAPWLAPYATVGHGIAAKVAVGVSNADALNAALAPNAIPVPLFRRTTYQRVWRTRVTFLKAIAAPPEKVC